MMLNNIEKEFDQGGLFKYDYDHNEQISTNVKLSVLDQSRDNRKFFMFEDDNSVSNIDALSPQPAMNKGFVKKKIPA